MKENNKYYWLSGLFTGLFSAITILLAVSIIEVIVKNICFPGNTLVLIVFAFAYVSLVKDFLAEWIVKFCFLLADAGSWGFIYGVIMLGTLMILIKIFEHSGIA